MQYTIAPSALPTVRTISRRAELTTAGIFEASTRLRSWALIRGEQLTGLPFLRISGESYCEVHIPVSGRVYPHPETGVSLEVGDGGPAVAVRVVQFEDLRAVMRELGAEIAVDCGIAGPVEFHPSSAEFRNGTVIWPVHRPLRSRIDGAVPHLVEVGA